MSFLTVFAIICIPMIALGQWETDPSGIITSEANLADASFTEILTRILKWLLGLLAILAVLAFVISGVFYITAGGSDRAETARGWLVGSIIGLVVALLGYVIVFTIDAVISGN